MIEKGRGLTLAFLRDSRIPLALRIYTASVILAGIPVFIVSLRESLADFSMMWLVLVVLCLLAGLFPIRLPSKLGVSSSLTLTVSDVFIFSGLLLLGPAKAVTIAVLDGVVGNFQTRTNRIYKKLFNLGTLALATTVSGHLLYFLLQVDPPLKPEAPPAPLALSAALAASAALFYAVNSGTVALAISLSTSEPLSKVWKTNLVWSSLATIAGASVAALVYLTSGRFWVYGIFFGIPIVLVIYNSYRINLYRINEAERHAGLVGRLYDSAIASLATAIDAKDQCTHGHLERVQVLSLGLARLFGLRDESELEALRAASLLHDIGKLAIPEHILNKPTGLSQWELRKMRTHPDIGAEILASVPFPYPVVPIVRSHHERWDGTGYPQGLKGEEIPLGARILAVADCYDALRSDRPYRRKLSVQATVDYIRSQSGTAYDPALVRVLEENIELLEDEMEEAIRSAPKRTLKPAWDGGTSQAEIPRGVPAMGTLFHETAAKQREIERLREMSQAFGRSFGLGKTLSILAGKIRGLVPCQALSIYLLDAEQGTFLARHVEGEQRETLQNVRIGWGEGVTGWVAANRQPLMNIHPRPEFARHAFLGDVFDDCLSVPLCQDDLVLGVITLYGSRRRPYDEDDLRLMQTLAHFSVSVITNALIHEEGQSERFTDQLTGLPDPRHFRHFAQAELRRSVQSGYPASLVLVAIEELDERDGVYGPQALAEVARLIQLQIRRTDLCCRKAERFQILLPGVGRQLLQPALLRIRQAIDQHRLDAESGGSISLRFSLGFAISPLDGAELTALEKVAERALRRDQARRRQLRESAAVLPFDKREMGR